METGSVVDHLFRHEAGRMVSTLTRVFGARHLDLAEEVVHEALLKALEMWPFSGVPENPSAWLIQVAKNRALDRLRRDHSLRAKEPELIRAFSEQIRTAPAAGDDRLQMMFLCCHPALNRPARIALTLKAVGGFGVPEIARAFLSQESTVAQRLVRAKRQIRDEGLTFDPLDDAMIRERLDSVLEVIYLIFNEGYSAVEGDQVLRRDIADEAIYLGRLLVSHPQTALPVSHALLALMLFHASRAGARTSASGNLLLMADQDRRLWDRAMLAEAFRQLGHSAEGERISAYHLQAAIAAEHAAAPSYSETNWERIIELYDDLAELDRSPVVTLNRAIALSRAQGPGAALPALLALEREQTLPNYHLLPASIGELYRELNRFAQARNYYEQALAMPCSEPERRFLEQRLLKLPRA